MAVKLKVGITGGPCGGKTRSKALFEEYLRKNGYIPIFIDEKATQVASFGIPPGGGEYLENLEYQKLVAKMQLQDEDAIISALESSQKDYVVFFDRTILDGRAYLDNDMDFQELLDSIELTQAELLERYDIIIHLVTAADGAVEFYTLANNQARSETPEEAIARDRLTKQAMYGHPYVYYIGNEYCFEEKLMKAVGKVLEMLGKTTPTFGRQRKFLVKKTSKNILQEYNSMKLVLIQNYLESDTNVERRIRKIMYPDDSISYYYTEKTSDKLIVVGRDYPITKKEYQNLLKIVNQEYSEIQKTRYTFSYNNLYFQYDEFTEWEDYAILEAEVTNLNDEVMIPRGFAVVKEVTTEKIVTNDSLAKCFITQTELESLLEIK